MPLHIASHAEGFAATHMRALERLFPGVRMAVDFETGRSREGFVAGRADVALLRLWVGRM